MSALFNETAAAFFADRTAEQQTLIGLVLVLVPLLVALLGAEVVRSRKQARAGDLRLLSLVVFVLVCSFGLVVSARLAVFL